MKSLVLILLATSCLAHAGEKSFHIEDPFGADHGSQAVRFEESFEKPGTALESLSATVNGAPAFFQRRALETFPDGSAKKAEWTLWLHLASKNNKGEGPVGSSETFDVRLAWGGPEARSAAFPGVPVKIVKEGDYLVVNTGPAEFRVPDGKIVSGANGPQGPIAGFRQSADPKWYGMNAAIEGAKITSVKTEVLANGPASAVIVVTFTDKEDLTWRSELTFTSGSPVVQIEDAMDFSGAWVIDLTADMAPDTQFACPWFDWESDNQRGAPSEKPLRAWKAADVRGGEWPDLNEFFRLDPKWHDYQYMKGPYAWYYNKADRTNRQTALALFAWNMSRWHPTNASRPRVFVQGNARGALRVRVPLTGGSHTRTLPADDPADPIPRVIRTSTAARSWGLGAFPVPTIKSPSEYLEPARAEALAGLGKTVQNQVASEKKALRKKAVDALRAAPAGQPEQGPSEETIVAKMRELGWPSMTDEQIVADRMKSNPEPPAAEIAKRASKLASAASDPVSSTSLQTLVRLAQLPVSKLKDWKLTWPDMDKNLDRGIFRGKEDMVALQREIQQGKTPLAKAVAEYVNSMKATLVTTTDAKGKVTESVDRKFGRDWDTARKIQDGDASSETVFFYNAGGGFRVASNWIYNSSFTDGMMNPTTAPRGVRATIWTNSINNAAKAAGLSTQNREMAVIAYIFSDPDFWNGRYYDWGIGNPNFHTDMHNIPGMVAAQINTHPDAKKWATYSVREIFADLARSSWQPGGGWTESPGYTDHSFSVFLPTAHAFQRSGLASVFGDSAFKGAIGYLMNVLTPPDKRRGPRGQAAIGDSGGVANVQNLEQAAVGYAKSDPAFSADLMAAARASRDNSSITPGTLGNRLSTTDMSLPANPGWHLASSYYGGVGSFMRSRFGKPDESFVTFKAGPARNHYQGDELAFTFWGNGDYLAVDYSSFYNPRMNPDWTHNKVSFGLAASSPVATVMAFESTPDADLSVAENVNDSLQLMTRPYASARSLWDYQAIQTSPKTDRRLLLLVKHPEGSPFADYLVVRDELSGEILDTLDPKQLQSRLQLVLEENFAAVIRDASLAPSQADELFSELNTHLKMLGADDATAASLIAAARKPVVADREAPAWKKAIADALPLFHFSHEPRSNFHLLALDNPKKSSDRLDFEGQLGTGIALFVSTGQNASQSDINWFGWGSTKRPPDFAKGAENPNGIPWNGGPYHSYRHGPVIGRDVRLPTDASSKLPPYAFGEMCQWVSLPFQGKDAMTVLLYPVAKGSPAPQFESLDGGKSIKVTVGGQSETVTLATGLPVKIVRGGKEITIAVALPPVGSRQPEKLTPRRSSEIPVDKPDDNPNPAALDL